MTMPIKHKIALLFNANKAYDREVMTGVASYLQSTRVSWDLFMEEDFRCRLNGIDNWYGDGIIADFDDPAVRQALAGSRLPVVAVGGSYDDSSHYPPSLPYVATDNFELIKMAFDHLVEAGLSRFALFSVPESSETRWAHEREGAFWQLMQRDNLWGEVYRGHTTTAPTWNTAVEDLIQWLQALPKPVGIIAVNDARARQLMQACMMAGIAVPEQVALVGIDNDPLARVMARIPFSSVMQGAEQMGRAAAHLLHQMLNGVRLGGRRVLVPPVGINVQASSRHETRRHPYVMRGCHYIRQYACQGIKTEQVADYVGISRSSLDAHFRRELGYSTHEEIMRFKLAAAAHVLASDGVAISEVAVNCGFTSVQYMNAVFKRELGCTPRQYRDHALERGEGEAAALLQARAAVRKPMENAYPPSSEAGTTHKSANQLSQLAASF